MTYKLSTAEIVARNLKNTENLTLNLLYKVCEQYKLNSNEIQFVKSYINNRTM